MLGFGFIGGMDDSFKEKTAAVDSMSG